MEWFGFWTFLSVLVICMYTKDMLDELRELYEEKEKKRWRSSA